METARKVLKEVKGVRELGLWMFGEGEEGEASWFGEEWKG